MWKTDCFFFLICILFYWFLLHNSKNSTFIFKKGSYLLLVIAWDTAEVKLTHNVNKVLHIQGIILTTNKSSLTEQVF